MPHRFPSFNNMLQAASRIVASWVLLATLAVTPASAQELVIRFFNVGQGDAALITSPEGKTALIDGGRKNGEASYELYLLEVDTLDLVVASHNHDDHIGGLWDILRTLSVRAYMENGVPTTTDAYYNLLAMLKAKQIQYLLDTPRIIQLGSVKLRILPTPAGEQSQNNSSVGVLLIYGDFTALFTGDAEGTERRFWAARADLPHLDVLKVAHHGASNGTDAAWLQVTQPRVAVVSVGARNRYGHPSAKTLRALSAAGAEVYRTDLDGDITVVADSLGGFSVRASQSDSVRSWPAAAAAVH